MQHRLFIEGSFASSSVEREIPSPWSGEVVATVFEADNTLLERALCAAEAASRSFRALSRHAKSLLLSTMAQGISARRDEIAKVICEEAGKPISLALGEVKRAITTFTVGAEEAKRYGGELVPIDIEASGRAYAPAVSMFFPRGPVLAITPFNFPLNLVAHKVAPALGIGAPILVKPAPQAPGAAFLLAEIFAEAAAEVGRATGESVPLAALQVVSASNEVMAAAIKDPRIAVLSFTGSAAAGFHLQSMAAGKKVLLELGGNASVIVHGDADLARAAARVAFGAFAYAGQVCISVQNVLVHDSVYEDFKARLLAEVAKVQWGDPAEASVLVGPLIDEGAIERVLGWVEEARASGARMLTGGSREGKVVLPTVLEDAPPSLKVVCEEVFGPVVILSRYRDLDEAIAQVNSSCYGLQAGVFTDSLRAMQAAVAGLDVGGVMINEIPTYRADQMPYGGLKASGIGREGLRYAMEEYSERKTVVVWRG